MTSSIKDLFLKPVDRRIDPAVVVDNTDPETIETEISEYVFTPGLTEQLYKLLNTLGTKATIKTGIWINGYYGSGKSHFLKFVSYCLNAHYQQQAFEHFIEEGIRISNKSLTEATPANAQNLLKRLQGSGTEVIMFNVEAVSPDNTQSRDKFLHMLLKQFNKHRGLNATNIPLALLLEDHLQQNGLFDAFKEAVEPVVKKPWTQQSAGILFSLSGRKVIDVAAHIDPTLDAETLYQKLKQPDAITIEDTLVPTLQAYLRTKPANYRLVFLLDEVSQYIGSNRDLLLNLQTIIESVEKACDRQVWVACTAQQTLEDLTSSAQVVKDDEVGKILGRFETRIVLDSKDAEVITQKRVLEKKPEVVPDLQQRYRQHQHAIQNQFHFDGASSYRGFADEGEFVRVYPFVPYQFHLIMKVFESFSAIGYVVREVKDNERSVLNITHATIRSYAAHPVGGFVPFDAFFNDLFETNLMHTARQSVHRARSVLQNTATLPDKLFADRVLRALFMLANLSGSELQHFPATREYLVTLLMADLDEKRLDLTQRTQEVLEVLMRENIIYLTDNAQLKFFKEEEIEVANQIRSTIVYDLDRFDNWNDVLLKQLGLNKDTRFAFGKNSFRLGYSVNKKDYGSTGDVQVRFFVSDEADAATLALNQPVNELAVCLSAWLDDPQNPDKSFMRDFNQFVQTRKYLSHHFTTSTGVLHTTLSEFGKRNEARLQSLLTRLKTAFTSVPLLAGQQRINPADLTGSQPELRLKSAIERLFKAVYKYQTEVGDYAHTNDVLRGSALRYNQTTTDEVLSPAEQRVEDWIEGRGGKATVSDVVNAFEDRPFGWKDLATIDVLLALVRKKRKEVEYQGGPMSDPVAFVEKALKSSERASLLMRTTEAMSPQLIQDAMRAFGRVFNQTMNLAPDATAVQGKIKEVINEQIIRFSLLATQYVQLPFAPALATLVDALRTLSAKRDAKALFEALIQQTDGLRTQCDGAKDLEAFITDRLSEYETMRQYVLAQQGNFASLSASEADQARALYDDVLNNTTPQETFAQNRKRFQAVKKALGDQVTQLRQQVRTAYETAFDELDALRTQHGIDEPHVIADRDRTLAGIDNLDSLTELALKGARVGDFKAEQIQRLIEEANRRAAPGSTVREPVTFEYGKQSLPNQIASERELEQYLAQLRQLLMAQLEQNRIIILK